MAKKTQSTFKVKRISFEQPSISRLQELQNIFFSRKEWHTATWKRKQTSGAAGVTEQICLGLEDIVRRRFFVLFIPVMQVHKPSCF